MKARIKIIDVNVGEDRDRVVFGLSAETTSGLAYTKGNTSAEKFQKFPGRIAPGDRFSADITAAAGAELKDKEGKGIGLMSLIPEKVDWDTLEIALPGYCL